MKIAFLDSGIGGLTVLNTAQRLFRNASYIYYADSLNAPYGNKSREEIKQLVLQAIDFLDKFGIDALVLACHTATRLFHKELQNNLQYNFPIIGMRTGLNSLTNSYPNQKILFCATDMTVQVLREEYQQAGHFEGRKKVEFLSLQKLVLWAERFQFEAPEIYNYLEKKFSSYDWEQYQTIVLGCTHFPFFKDQIRSLIPPHVQIVDGSRATTKQLLRVLPYSKNSKSKAFEYYISGKFSNSSILENISLFNQNSSNLVY